MGGNPQRDCHTGLDGKRVGCRVTILPLEPRDVTAAVCLNCDAPLSGPYCARCGQRDVPPYPSVGDLVVDAFWELSGWDGRFASTVKTLVRRPGMLTREFLEGRRARYISPLRLYLMASLVYFLIAAAAANVQADSLVRVISTTPAERGVTISRPQRVAQAASGALTTKDGLTAEEKAKALKDIEQAPSPMRVLLRKAISDPSGFKRARLEAMPRMLFVLLPIFAGIVALFYRKRNYPEHLYFAIHVHSFIFLALGAVELLKLTRIPALPNVVGFVCLAWIPVYATMAFRRVYGGSLAMTIVKEAAIAAIYGVVALVALVATIYIVSLTT